MVLDGDREVVYQSVDDEQAVGDRVYAADVAEATGLPEDRVKVMPTSSSARRCLTTRTPDESYGVRYLRSRGA